MRVLTFNLFFYQQPKGRRRRAKAILSRILKLKPDVIHLQEMIPKEIKLFMSVLGRRGYEPVDDEYSENDIIKDLLEKKVEYGSVIFAKIPNGHYYYVPFSKSKMGRGMACLQLGEDKTFISTHLESGTESEGIRVEQLKELLDYARDTNVVVAMDSNIRGKITLPGFIDIWEKEPVPTWHGDRYLKKDINYRYDRVLVKGFTILNKFVDDMHGLSDHDAMVVDVISR